MKTKIPHKNLVELAPATIAVTQIEQQIASQISSGKLPLGASMPTTRALALELGVSSFTVSDAYQRLAASGFLEARKKSSFLVKKKDHFVNSMDIPIDSHVKDYAWLLQESPRKNLGILEISGSNLPPEWEDHRIAKRAFRAVSAMGESVLHAPVESMGYLPLRDVLQSRLQNFGVRCHRDQIVVTGGATAALSLLTALLVNPGDAVLVDDPGFFALHGLLHLRGAKVVGVPRDAKGPDLLALSELIQKFQPKIFIFQSVLHSPTGSSIQADIAMNLITLCTQHQIKIIECDFYADLAVSAHLRLAQLGTLDQVIYVGACAKTVTGSARIGYIACTAGMAVSIGKLKLLYGSVNPPIHERLAYRALTDSQCARHISKLATQLQISSSKTNNFLQGSGFVVHSPNAEGKYLWVRHPTIKDSSHLAEKLEKYQISLAPGKIFRPEAVPTAWFRVNVTTKVELLVSAIDRLKQGILDA